jgi:arsenate reductase
LNRPLNVVFLCTGNSARSILAEATLNHLGAGRFRAFSAGSSPAGRVNPYALETLAAADIQAAGARSKSWDEFAKPGHPASAHWGLPDPAAATGSAEAIRASFAEAYAIIRLLIDAVIAEPCEALAPNRARDTLTRIARNVLREEAGA